MAPLTLKVQGEGGGVWDMDVPPAGSHAREHFDAKIASGQLLVLGDDEETMSPAAAAELIKHEGGLTPLITRKVRGPQPTEDDDDPEHDGLVAPPKVGTGSGRDAWAVYATPKGVDVDAMNKTEIIAALDAAGIPT